MADAPQSAASPLPFRILYCGPCGYEPRARELAVELQVRFGAEVEIEEEGRRLRLRKMEARMHAVPMLPAAAPALPLAAAPAPEAPPAAAPAAPKEALHTIKAPMVGTFYRSPSPDAEPYVDVASRVSPENVVCILEAMKVMNEIKAEREFEVLDVLVKNGEPVEFGQPLFLVR